MKGRVRNQFNKLIIKVFLTFIVFPSIFAQRYNVDSIYNILQNEELEDSTQVKLYQKIAIAYKNTNIDSSLLYLKKAEQLSQKLDNDYIYCKNLLLLGDHFNRVKSLDSMKYYYNRGLFLANKNDYNDVKGMIYNGYGVYHKDISNYDTALVFLHQAVKISESISDLSMLNKCYNNIGIIHYHLGNYDKALFYYKKSLEIRQNIGYTADVALVYNNIGIIYYFKGDINLSIEYFKKALEIYRKEGNLRQIALPLYNIAELYGEQKKYHLAINYLREVYSIENKLNDTQGKSNTLLLIGSFQSKLGQYDKAIENQFKGMNVLRELGAKKDLSEAYAMISETYELAKEYKKSLKYFQKYSNLRDSIINGEKLKLLTEVETKFETEKKEQQILLQETKISEQKAKVKKKNIQIVAFIAVSFLLLLLVFAAYRSYKNKKRANVILANQKEEIESQRDEIEAQRNMVQNQKERIEFQQKEIKDSIRYAQRIQSAILPPDDYLNKILSGHFIINMPRDIVGGDFYWVNRKGNKLFMAVADCTGHGVPGGFMSMMGVSFLNEMLNEPKTFHTNQILELLRKYVIDSLHQTSESGSMKDGMDISLCIYDTIKKTIEFSGAFSTLYLYHGDELIEIRGDKMPIGFYRSKSDAPFTKHTIEIKKDTMIYMFTDGYIDQFGGVRGEKFKTDNLKSLLQVIYNKPIEDQKEILYDNHILWKGIYDQIDDILIMGIKLKVT